jgi:predicted O-linked N-acetylglucosamine transferase (SPINDLY family)
MRDLNEILTVIKGGGSIEQAELLPYLCAEPVLERCEVNAKLATAYFQAGNVHQAKSFVQRAWVLSEFSPDLLSLYVDINAACNDVAAIREAYKRVGMREADSGKIADAIRYFSMSMYAYARHQNVDKYEYDFDILTRIDELAKPLRYEPRLDPRCLDGRKIRLAYLMFGMCDMNSVVVKINLLFAQFHDKSRFEVVFFVPQDKIAVFGSAQGSRTIERLQEFHCKVVIPRAKSEEERVFEVSRVINQYQPDILVTSALLGHLIDYFIVALRPAPLTVGFIMGPPQQFALHCLDRGIPFTKHPLMDAPCDCSLVDLEVDLPVRDNLMLYTKQQFNIPEESILLMSGGRHVKFQEPAFWSAIFDIMHNHPDVYYVVVGTEENEIPFLQAMVPAKSSSRLSFFGWREDFLKILSLADIVIDTFPSGGGVVLMDAMALGIPVVSFKNNYMQLFDQTDWSPAEEFIPIPDLLIDRGDFVQMKSLLTKLITDQAYRIEMAKLCKESINVTKGNPERMVRKCEGIYLDVLRKKLEQGTSQGIVQKHPSVVRDMGKVEYHAMKILSGLIRLAVRVKKSIKRITS